MATKWVSYRPVHHLSMIQPAVPVVIVEVIYDESSDTFEYDEVPVIGLAAVVRSRYARRRREEHDDGEPTRIPTAKNLEREGYTCGADHNSDIEYVYLVNDPNYGGPIDYQDATGSNVIGIPWYKTALPVSEAWLDIARSDLRGRAADRRKKLAQPAD